jgi:hypothetical protein
MARSDASSWKEAGIKEFQGLINCGCFKIVDRRLQSTSSVTLNGQLDPISGAAKS